MLGVGMSSETAYVRPVPPDVTEGLVVMRSSMWFSEVPAASASCVGRLNDELALPKLEPWLLKLEPWLRLFFEEE